MTYARRLPRVRIILLIALIGGVILLFGLSLALGSVRIPLDQATRLLLGLTVDHPDASVWRTILFKFRLPKAITGALAGAALAVAGAQMQTLFRNPLADPFILGISSGASLGVALIVLGSAGLIGGGLLAGSGIAGSFGIAGASALGSILIFALIILIARRSRGVVMLLVLGLMISYAAGALVSLLLYFAIPQRIQAYLAWTFGSFGGVTWDQLWAFIPAVLIGLGLAWGNAKALDALLLGEPYARSMGVRVGRARAIVICSASLLAGTVTAFCGPIAFLGLTVPHVARAVVGRDAHRAVIPTAALIGAGAALAFDLIAALPGAGIVLPLNAITALFGAPLVILILLRRGVS